METKIMDRNLKMVIFFKNTSSMGKTVSRWIIDEVQSLSYHKVITHNALYSVILMFMRPKNLLRGSDK